MSVKKRYLLVWPTVRKDWIRVFEGLSDEFDFTFLPSTFPKESNYAHSFDCYYWSEFNSAQEILSKIQPDGIIFMSIESGLSMALNHVAKKQSIKTLILQHGIFTNYKDYRNREKLWRKRSLSAEVKQEQTSKSFSTLRFVRNSLPGLGAFEVAKIAVYSKLQQSFGPYWVARNFPLNLKKASQYLCFSPYNAKIHKETDRIDESQIAYIGCQELIPYLKEETDLIEEDFYLHIDQALAENSLGEETVPKSKMIDFYLKLNDFSLSKGAKLYIKLHPESYKSDWLPQHANITYLRQVDNFNRIVQSARGCFGFYSTMIIPAVYWKPTVLFKIQYSGLQEAIDNIGGVTILDFWNFKSYDILLVDNQAEKDIIKRQFILPDGVDQHTLKNLLNG